jgi:two-component system NtrC family sensor kinase
MDVLASGDVRNLEQTMYRRDRSPVAVEISSSVLENPQPSASAFIIVLRDISERKQAEQALTAAYQGQEILNQNLTRSRNLLRALFDNLSDGLVLLDGNGTVQSINKALAALLNSTPDYLDGRHWDDLYPRLFSGSSAEIPTLASWYDGTHPERIRYCCANDMTRIIDIYTIMLGGPDHADNQLIVHTTDVTESLRLQAQLIETERFAASGKLAASIAHEINTPLLSLDFSLEMAQIAPPGERHTFLSEARQEIQRIARIVRQLLDLYRPGATQREPVDMNTLLDRMLLLTGKWVRDHGVVIERDLSPTLPRLYGRADELIQVLLNLVMNAVQAMPDGGMLSVQTSADETTSASPAIIVTIRDTGVGMSPELQARIFEPFLTTREDGTGLGLAISKQIVEQHGGAITVVSEPDQGSTFTIRLPMAAEHASERPLNPGDR